MLHDIVEKAEQGCPSCSILAAGILRLSSRQVSKDSRNIEVDVVFCLARVLRASVYVVVDEGGSVDIFGQVERSGERDLVASLDFYTLPGTSLFSLRPKCTRCQPIGIG